MACPVVATSAKSSPAWLAKWCRGRDGLAVVLLLLLGGCAPPAGPAGKSEMAPPEVVVAKPLQTSVTDYAEYTGRTAAIESVELRARVSGYLTSIEFKAGEEVEAGKVLFQIDERPFKATLDAAEAEVTRIDALIAKATEDVKRRVELRKQNVIPQEELEAAIAAKAVDDASRAGALAAVEQAKLNLEFSKITAPVSGRMGRPLITVGNLITAGSGPESLLTTLVSVDPVYVYFDIDEQTLLEYMRRVRGTDREKVRGSVRTLNIPVEISLANETEFLHKGVLEFVDNQVNLSTGTLQARALFDNQDRQLQIGLFVRVRLPVAEPYEAVLVPEVAIGTDQTRRFVYVVGDDARVRSQVIELGTRQPNGNRVVKSGLKGDERIIVEGLLRARPGRKVTPVDQTATIAEKGP